LPQQQQQQQLNQQQPFSFNLASQRQQPVIFIDPYGNHNNNSNNNVNNSQTFLQQHHQQQQPPSIQSPFQPIYPIQTIQPGIIVLPSPSNLSFLPPQQQQQFYPVPAGAAQFYTTPAPLTHLNQPQFNQQQQQQQQPQLQQQKQPQKPDNTMMYNGNQQQQQQQHQHQQQEGYNNEQYDQNDEYDPNYDDVPIENEDMKQQQIWNRLQKSREESVRKKGRSPAKNAAGSRSNGLPPTVPKRQPMLKPEQDRTNFLEKNIDSIRNKENLSHRFPEKKYEVLYDKYYKNRAKSE
jgi:hypothetical protein